MDTEKLGRILALAASDTEVEAMRALQAAKRMLAAADLDFLDLANLLMAHEDSAETEMLAELEETLRQLRRDNRHLKMENRRLRADSLRAPPESTSEIAWMERQLAAERLARSRIEAIHIRLTEQMERLETERQVLVGENARLATEIARLALLPSTRNETGGFDDHASTTPRVISPKKCSGPTRRRQPKRQYSLFEAAETSFSDLAPNADFRS